MIKRYINTNQITKHIKQIYPELEKISPVIEVKMCDEKLGTITCENQNSLTQKVTSK